MLTRHEALSATLGLSAVTAHLPRHPPPAAVATTPALKIMSSMSMSMSMSMSSTATVTATPGTTVATAARTWAAICATVFGRPPQQ